jgi:hypothetical protein
LNACPYRATVVLHHRPRVLGSMEATTILTRGGALMALDLYNGEVIRTAPTVSSAVTLQLNVGDTVIWHPELPHGGTAAQDPMRTRWSVVFHCAPKHVQVHQHDQFFLNASDQPPPDRYGYRHVGGRGLALSGDVAFM